MGKYTCPRHLCRPPLSWTISLNPLFLPPPSSMGILDQPSKSLQQPPFNSLSSSFCRHQGPSLQDCRHVYLQDWQARSRQGPPCRHRHLHLLDISDDGFLSLMTDDGDTKDDVKVPDGEVGDRINKLFKEEEKDVNVVILTAMGEQACMDAKEAPRG